MASGICNNHGKVEAEWKEGVSKTGNKYAFWGCPVKGKNPNTGSWWKCKVEVANTPSGKFEQELDKAGAQSDAMKKDATITRLAIAKSMIERGDKWGLETAKELEAWLSWVENRNPLTSSLNKAQEHVSGSTSQVNPTNDDVRLEDIPF